MLRRAIDEQRTMKTPTKEASPPLTESARAVLRTIAEYGSVTRPQLGALLALSKPTMSAAVAELDALRLVAAKGVHKGATGRSAQIYGLGPGAGYVVGVDIGATQVRALAYGLDDERLGASTHPIAAADIAANDRLTGVVDEVMRQVTPKARRHPGPLRAIAVAVPLSISEHRLKDTLAPLQDVLSAMRKRLRAPIILENNVNCAAIAEHRFGAAREADVFAYLQVGVRIGLGLVIGGKLFRGAGGFAGEVGRIPFPWSESEVPTREALEHYLGATAFMARVAAGWPADAGAPPPSARELFELAAAGSETARSWVDRHARDIGRLMAACIGMFDPGRIVLGGGVGQNPMLVGEVSRVVRELTWPSDITVGTLGDDATALGAMRIASQYGLAQLTGDPTTAIVLPTTRQRRS
ncbi:ROK family transcriptional regulator [Devosia ginsengisoli]|uniref:ROK family transcriptional regulator n=1 Tax=Devosia ginsengisoli TaxID=400770 RepID=UPI0026EB0DBB|nr:ROK family transcriptional regulator [Devosia ginsengisoli]MCR6671871.1 ROK family protein [Devosia ginsengisoli]